jgi:hypothetical protein
MRHACPSDPTLFCLTTLIIFNEERDTRRPKYLHQELPSTVNRKVIGKLLNQGYDVTYARRFDYTYYYCNNIKRKSEGRHFTLNRCFIAFIRDEACLENVTTTA